MATSHIPSQPIADTVVTNGLIYTVNPDQPWVEAAAIKDGVFVFVGDSVTAQTFCGPNTDHINLNGRFAMPGLHDMHIHGIEGALGQLFSCQIPATATAEDIVKLISQFAAEHPEDPVVMGQGWMMNIATDIDRQKLDAVCPDRPVFLWDGAFHNAWCNSAMLELAGVDGATPNPDGGEIIRDATGEPTGLLLEMGAAHVYQAVPERTEAQFQQAVSWLAQTLNAHGVTSIKEAAVYRAIAQAYKAADAAGTLNLRVGLHFLWLTPFMYDPADLEPLVADRHQFAGERVKVDFLKLFLDGVPAARTAAMLDPYVGDDPQTHDPHAMLLVDPDTLKEVLVHFDAAGMLVKMHATGDASLRVCLDAIEAARQANGDSGIGHEIAHPQNVHPADLPRFAQLGAVADLCPKLWHPSINKENFVKKQVGDERVERSWPIGSYQRSGAHIIGGTDWPAMVPTVNLFPSIQTLVTREDPTGQVSGKLGDDEEIDVATAIEIFTINGARSARHQDVTGSIEVGKYADMIVLDRNIVEIPAGEIGKTKVLKTFLEGELVYQMDDATHQRE